jgi:hypothetical protein
MLKADLRFRNEERLFALEDKEIELKTTIQSQSLSEAKFTGAEEQPTTTLKPIFPVEPYGSSTSMTPDILPKPVEKTKKK